ESLWLNTGTLCNVECAHCYIESSPTNDRLAYLTAAEVRPYLDEAREIGAAEIGITGGEPFMNPDILEILADALARDFRVLVLTNAMRPMMRPRIIDGLKAFGASEIARLNFRVSLDHYTGQRHDEERGAGSFEAGVAGAKWLAQNGFALTIAGRNFDAETDEDIRKGYGELFAKHDLPVDAHDPGALVIFPEMDERADVPEITESCWGILGVSAGDMMCATSRMLIKRKGETPSLASCTLIPYDRQFEMGATLKEAAGPVSLNHPHCAKFCVLGGASCSG
ncbi:MAG: radical SAM protein, partial [Marinicaulis sp.]|nr:radical SAM protein [Marinicaulis sp.]